MKRAMQKETIFYRLYKHHENREKRFEYIPVFELMGEIYIPEVSKWGYVSYECSARTSEMVKENPGLIVRSKMRGKSGASYYGYRFCLDPNADMIKDPMLVSFYKSIKKHREETMVYNNGENTTDVSSDSEVEVPWYARI